ncbi:hypothetical protein [Parvularcula maris]|uniref:Secreted protein n=1 Tax=Parvularcula maris TaxID=2965077 RepID=A0A9X2LB33_9PROT|nr:hypothetical protein [Parvularcula maris]MCQ8186402.1 hypothetical protein [Parvularcula maris]
MRQFLAGLSVLALAAACSAEDVTDSEEYEELEEQAEGTDAPAMPTDEQTPGADPVPSGDALRSEDMPDTGEEMTTLPIEPGTDEPGGKDELTEKELEAMNKGDDPSTVSEPPRR